MAGDIDADFNFICKIPDNNVIMMIPLSAEQSVGTRVKIHFDPNGYNIL